MTTCGRHSRCPSAMLVVNIKGLVPDCAALVGRIPLRAQGNSQKLLLSRSRLIGWPLICGRCRATKSTSLVRSSDAGLVSSAGPTCSFPAAVILVDGGPSASFSLLPWHTTAFIAFPRCDRLCVPACRCISICRRVACVGVLPRCGKLMGHATGSAHCLPAIKMRVAPRLRQRPYRKPLENCPLKSPEIVAFVTYSDLY